MNYHQIFQKILNNNFSQFSISQHHSKVLTDQFEPGSTFKIVAATASLAEEIVSLEEEFSCENGEFDYFGSIIKEIIGSENVKCKKTHFSSNKIP